MNGWQVNGWQALLLARVFEITWAIGLKYSAGLSRLWPTLARQLRWARLRRDSFKSLFGVEVLAGSAPAFLAGAIAAGAAGFPVVPCLLALGALWYAAETWLCLAAGWHLSRRSLLIWLMRDLLLPVLWAASWLGRDFVWRNTPMRIAGRGRDA
jgi:ceramide glucosyltransferase